MPKRRRRSFTPQFKAQVVLEVLSGLKSQAEVARWHKLKPELIARWKEVALDGLETLFRGGEQRDQDLDRVAELERMVGRLTMELEVAKKSRPCCPRPCGEAGRRPDAGGRVPDPPDLPGDGMAPKQHLPWIGPGGRRGPTTAGAGAAGRPLADLRLSAADGHAPTRGLGGQREARPAADGRDGSQGQGPVRRRRTTDSRHDFPRYPNLVVGLEVTRPDHVWVADITYVRLREESVYLAVVMDVFTRRVRGWELGRSLRQGLTLAALRRALRRGRRPGVHHSDQGVQYAATAYTDLLAGRGVAISMASVGKPEENGFAERLMRTIREEEIDLSEYRDFADAYRQPGRFLDDVDNRKWIHSAPGYLTPAEFERQWLRGRKASALP